MRITILAVATVAALLVAACGEPAAQPTPVIPTPAVVAAATTPTPQPTSTHTPTRTPEPTPTREPTATVTPEPTPTPKPTATPTPEPTPTPDPTPTPEPTSTPEPPATATPDPTSTPEPTPTPTAEESAVASLSAFLPWLQSPPDDTHADAGDALIALWLLDASLAERVAATGWVVDGVSEVETGALAALSDLTSRAATLAITLAGLPSVIDGVSEVEAGVITRVSSLALSDLKLAREVVGLAWSSDDLKFAQTITELPWAADGITRNDSFALSHLRSIARIDLALASSVAEMPWMSDSISEVEAKRISDLASMAKTDRALALSVVKLPWVSDGISDAEASALADLDWLAQNDPALAKTVSEMPWVTNGQTSFQAEAVGSMSILGVVGELHEVVKAPWYADGLNDEDMALLSILIFIQDSYPPLFKALLNSYDVKSTTISLPLAGEVRLWAFDPISFREDEAPLRYLEDAARATEAFMGEPFPDSDVIIVTSYDTKYGGGAWHGDQLIFVARWGQVPLSAPTVYHEVAHYYFTGGIGPSWLIEGGATFMAAVTRDAVGVETLDEYRSNVEKEMERTCYDDGISTIQELNTRRIRIDSVHSDSHPCGYSMGAHFLTMLTLTLGKQATSSALRELYVTPREDGQEASEEEIYRAFLKHTPPELEPELRALYKRLHGGTFDDEG